jgi:hypothetical protein
VDGRVQAQAQHRKQGRHRLRGRQGLQLRVATFDKSEKGDHDVSKAIVLKIQ